MLFRLLAADLRTVLKRNAVAFIAMAVMSIANLVYAYGLSVIYGTKTEILGFADNFALVFAGSTPFEFRPGAMFVPPLGWLFLTLLILYTTLDYSVESLRGFGLQTLVRCRTRWLWWVSRFVLVTVVTTISLLVVVCSVVLWSLATGASFSTVIHSESLQLVSLGKDFLTSSEADGLPFFAGLFLAFESLAFMQLAVGFAFGPSVAFVTLVSYLICSAYTSHCALLGNALMLLRWDGMVKGGVSVASSALVSLAIMAACLLMGGFWFWRADFIERKGTVWL
ncbi:hypothetical protein DXD94_04710 [Collinsella sp. TM10-22]|jgi:hypothetical protein|uniref:hypothetical protein n=1 Tax=unclassified Collinsella TaxID=2637548 RepID=UPI000E4386F6|nr:MULTISPECIES: hypothetical protein [unclassified Collinsella]RGI67864.1 hypothetical protein DXD94_04710 [Collinsella sp. TM10-22]RGM76047.1 hypothetical protein DXB98_01440 [Collinsella sp. OM07-12]RGT44570.1 hypothetical protein DWX25_08950 [Collinsella sp. AF18-8LB]RGT51678.1 hypothetical protein DWX24_04025 [Collinsella sp. AF18-8]RGT63918.1 hypothetical protein DWX16_08985 [Collinsella sp. AF18-33LB]